MGVYCIVIVSEVGCAPVFCLLVLTVLTYCGVFWWCTPLIRRVLVWTIGFISTLVTHSLLITLRYRQNSAIVHLHTLEFIVAHAVGSSVSTHRLPATDPNTQTIRVLLNHTLQILLHYSTHKVFTSHFKSSRHTLSLHRSINFSSSLDFTYSSHSQPRTNQELTSRGCLPPRTNWELTSVSPINPWSNTGKTTVLLLLRHCGTRGGHVTPPYCCAIQAFTFVAYQWETCLPQCCVATFVTRLSRRGKHFVLIWLRNHHVYRGTAYELPEQIHCSILFWFYISWISHSSPRIWLLACQYHNFKECKNTVAMLAHRFNSFGFHTNL
jgi:hypothetical protein